MEFYILLLALANADDEDNTEKSSDTEPSAWMMTLVGIALILFVSSSVIMNLNKLRVINT